MLWKEKFRLSHKQAMETPLKVFMADVKELNAIHREQESKRKSDEALAKMKAKI